jgi:hypothetical protein
MLENEIGTKPNAFPCGDLALSEVDEKCASSRDGRNFALAVHYTPPRAG